MLQKLDQYFKRPLGLILIVAYKGIFGLVEIVLGSLDLFLVYVVRHVATSEFISVWITKELAEDPQDIFINWLLSHAGWVKSSLAVGWVLIILGAIKIILAIGVWYRLWIVRDIGVIFFSGVAVYGVYELAVNFSLLKMIILFFDMLILFYFWQALPKHLGPRKKIMNGNN
ncbi:MAG: DUF2127 domain-containing protein [Patescibacteria group bacterium]|jgi:uncharacterized membrane protein